jgi:hypothetical protein
MGFFNTQSGSGFDPQPVIWEAVDWVTLIDGTAAPTPAVGGDGWFYVKTTATKALYGPATFNSGLLPAGVWDWGSPLSNVVFSTTGPTNEAGSWYVWDEFGDGSVYVLFQKKTAVNYGDMLFWSGAEWEARSQKISADDVYADLTSINSTYGVDAVKTQLQNLFSNYAQGYNGGSSFFVESNVSSTYEVNPFDGNGFVLTMTANTELSFTAAWDPDSGLGTRFAELTLVVKQDGTGGWSLTWDANVKVPTGTTYTTAANGVDMFKAVSWDNGTTWYVTQIGKAFA